MPLLLQQLAKRRSGLGKSAAAADDAVGRTQAMEVEVAEEVNVQRHVKGSDLVRHVCDLSLARALGANFLFSPNYFVFLRCADSHTRPFPLRLYVCVCVCLSLSLTHVEFL